MQRLILQQKGLYTNPNQLQGLPNGSMVVADNIVINRENVVESRRGNAQYGNTFGSDNDRISQLLTYKNRILAHYNSTLLFNANPHNNTIDGNFEAFSGSYNEIDPGLRLRSVESNKNLYFTSSSGIKKISARTADDFTTSANFIKDAGAAKALGVTGTLNSTLDGFLPPNSEVAYRVVWSYNDINSNLIAGSPSSRLVVTNTSTSNANVDLEFVIPQNIDDTYFYQVYRSAVITATGSLTLADLDPGDELQLVIEDFPTTGQRAAGVIDVTDIAPEDFRQGGLFLYTNPSSGDGIAQANEPPPLARDATMYQNTVFYSNTMTRANKTINLLGVELLVSGTSSVTIDDTINPSQTYTFVGSKEATHVDFTSYSGSVPSALNGKYFLINSSSDKHKYYVWFDTTKTTQTVDFTNYIGTVPTDLASTFFVLYTPDPTRTYYIWYDTTGTDIDPGINPSNNLTGFAPIKVNIHTGVTTVSQLATATGNQIIANDVNGDFDVTITGPSIAVVSESFDTTNDTINQNILKGFAFTFTTPANSDPANNLGVNTDVVGRNGFPVKIARGVTTVIEVADAVAASMLQNDSASDFVISYTPGNKFLDVTNSNNGITTAATDSGINPIGHSFAITVTATGTGENAASKQVLLSAAASPAQQIDETARSLVNVINKNASESVYAYYLSGPNDLPGQIQLEVRDIGDNQFNVTANNAATGSTFNPALPPATGAAPVSGVSETKPNRLYYAKLQQPEAVPLLNFIDIGPADKQIYRILALRESLFVLKEDGIYRLTGTNGAFTVDLFDESTKTIAPDSAVVLNNQIYCLTNQGFVTVSDTGVSIITTPIDQTIRTLSSANYDFKYTTFGVSYETDHSYILWMPSSTSDTVATQAFRFNTITQTFTVWPISKTAGLVNPGDDKLYLGPADENFIERERKLFDRTDYADRQFNLVIPAEAVNGDTLRLSSSVLVNSDDALIQTQNLSISEYNQLLKKLDLDPAIGQAEVTEFDFTSYSGSIPNDLHSKYFILYAASDATRYVVFYDAHGDLPSLDPSVFVDIADATQIRVDISSGVSTTADLANATQIAIRSATFNFIITYISLASSFQTKTIRNGNTTDASDSAVNPVGNGFAITILTQGLGDYFNSLQALAGDNIFNDLTALATKLDADPGVQQNDFVASIAIYSGTASTVTLGNPTVITKTAHGLQNGRLVTITNSTTTPSINGQFVITKIDANNFSIPITTTVGGTCDWLAGFSTFPEAQGAFNTIVNKLNIDTQVTYQNYLLSVGTKEFEVLVISKLQNTTDVTTQFSMPFLEGPITVYNGINCIVQYCPETFQDTSLLKQVNEGTVIFEDNNFSSATVGYRTDLSPGFETINFTKAGKGDWGYFIWDQQNWGGGFSGVPLRTYIPRQKQRNRFIQLEFLFSNAREKFVLYGFSFTYRIISEKAYRS